jgi:hypothetical protein
LCAEHARRRRAPRPSWCNLLQLLVEGAGPALVMGVSCLSFMLPAYQPMAPLFPHRNLWGYVKLWECTPAWMKHVAKSAEDGQAGQSARKGKKGKQAQEDPEYDWVKHAWRLPTELLELVAKRMHKPLMVGGRHPYGGWAARQAACA